MTGRRRWRGQSDARTPCPTVRQAGRPADLGAAVRRLQVEVTRAQLAGGLTPAERRALTSLIAAVARLLDEKLEH